MLLKVGISDTRLSFVQADLVCKRLLQTTSRLSLEKKVVLPSKADLIGRDPLRIIRKKRNAEREIDRAVIDGRVDFAVCDMKKVPLLDEDSRLVIAAVPERGSPAEALVSRGDKALKDLLGGSVLGVSNPVRAAQLGRTRPDITVERITGDLEARMGQVDRRKVDGVIFAEAGLARLGLTGRIAERLSLKDFIPSPGQGALAAVARRGDTGVEGLLRGIEHPPTRAEIVSERHLSKVVSRECRVPLAALASFSGSTLELDARVLSADGVEEVRAWAKGKISDSVALAERIGKELIERGVEGFEEGWRKFFY